MIVSGRIRSLVTVRGFLVLATCYAEPNGWIRPEAVIQSNVRVSLDLCFNYIQPPTYRSVPIFNFRWVMAKAYGRIRSPGDLPEFCTFGIPFDAPNFL
jgi:hypothetical protein